MIRGLTQLHENERLVAAAQTWLGRLVLWCAAISLLFWLEGHALMLAALTVVMLDPSRKRAVASLAAVGMIGAAALERTHIGLGDGAESISTDPFQWLMLAGGVAGALGLLCVAILVVVRFEQWPAIARRYPVTLLHGGIWLVLALSTLPGLAAPGVVSLLAWRLSYLVKLGSRGKAAGTKLRDHLFYLVPVFGGGEAPYGKGLEFLSRHEARDPDAFARSQLAGLKLLLLAILWLSVDAWMDRALFGQTSDVMDPPDLSEIMRVDLSLPWYRGWEFLYLELVRNTLELAAAGHVIVGSLRLLGFNVFRNTYRPLLSESILEFWNRYFFYFKELLVDFFFYPTYLRLRSSGLRLRLFTAVFAAAFVGNMYFHLLLEPESVVRLDFSRVWAIWGPRLVYCLLLAFGIWISMVRQRQQRRTSAAASLPIRLRRIAGVWTFYAIIQIWNVRAEDLGSLERLRFFLSLFGL